jgi:hypothetical protein
METNNRHPSRAFVPCGTARLSREQKTAIAMGVYLTLEALNDMAPRGCDGMPMELMVEDSEDGASVQTILTNILIMLRAPIPPEPQPEFVEGRCGCGDKLTSEVMH